MFYCRCFFLIFYLFLQGIAELCWPIAVKFCMMITSRLCFIMLVQNCGGSPRTNFRSQKLAKFGAISDDFKVWRQMSLEWKKIFQIGQVFDVQRFLPH